MTPPGSGDTQDDKAYDLIYSRTAKRDLSEILPEKTASAAFEFITGPLRENPYRVGAALDPPLAPARKAKRADYRVIYLIDDDSHAIEIVTVQHRSDVYHSQGKQQRRGLGRR
ncbi:MAG: type II toxin-antitoxin system RelE/ParE family toxin [Nocardiopsaceae bacterium]|nr:type II toxin-antitoxin system RelE/ParE family toxin [Nocardiopsaceae bacterium]